jgi:hypothetical protein
LRISSAAVHWIIKHSTGSKLGVTCSMKLTNYGKAGVSRLGGGMRNVFIFFLVFLSRFNCAGISMRRRSESSDVTIRLL